MAGRVRPPARARERWIDSVTGQNVKRGTPGAVRSGALFVSASPGPKPREIVDIGAGEVGPARTSRAGRKSYPVTLTDREIRARARQVVKARRALERLDAQLRRRKKAADLPGVRAIKPAGRKAADQYLARNAEFYSQFTAAGLDVQDQLREWADAQTTNCSGRSRKQCRLPESKAGERIFGSGGRNDQTVIRDLVRWIFSQANGRRWDGVEWGSVDEIDDALREAHAGAEANVGWQPLSAEVRWFPAMSGRFDAAQLASHPDLRDNPKALRVLAREANATTAKDAHRRLSEAYAAGSGCLTPETAKIVRMRIRLLAKIARAPELADGRAFCFKETSVQGAGEDLEGVEAGACEFPTIIEDSRRIAAACSDGYDPAWPLDAKLRQFEVEALPAAVQRARRGDAPRFVMPSPEPLDIPF